MLAAQFKSVVVLLLVAGAIVAAATGDMADALAIAAVLVLNVGMGFAIEIRAHRAIEALDRLEARRATVLRDGILREIDARDLVPGDIVALDAGQSVPADARVLSSTELRVVEASLTGEPVPVPSVPDAEIGVNAPLAERHNSVYAGTTVSSGTGMAVVVATGGQTELGHIGQLVSETRVEQTPLQRQLDTLGSSPGVDRAARRRHHGGAGLDAADADRGGDSGRDCADRCRRAGRTSCRRHDHAGAGRTPHGAAHGRSCGV